MPLILPTRPTARTRFRDRSCPNRAPQATEPAAWEAHQLASIGIDVADIRRRADASFGPGAFQFPRPVYTPEARKALENTLGEARALGCDRFGTAHILLGLLTVPEGHALQVLAALGVDPAGLRETALDRAAQEGA
ncbi:Clp protease N-terminal domain-containing protein [Streptomyces sp. CC224B]|uniref:Clp protease N-terminal domain-containing protein n=1 Tax=Streptomyces sp. CC224B TaxID=3044571 RepID=UPI0024A87E19|nr:Clp protease N-terminal domain-containing protein [Streptomyces sp. CC224B]